VGVTGDDEGVAERGRFGRRVGGVHHREPEAVRRPARRDTKVVRADVSVVETEELDGESVERELEADVGQVLPALRSELPDQIRRAAPPGLPQLPRPAEVGEVIQRLRDEVVVRTEDEPAREAAPGGLDRVDRGFDGLGLGEEVAGDDRDVGPGQPREETGLARVAAEEVEIGQMQDRQSSGPIGR
jgi:hypothetical protein